MKKRTYKVKPVIDDFEQLLEPINTDGSISATLSRRKHENLAEQAICELFKLRQALSRVGFDALHGTRSKIEIKSTIAKEFTTARETNIHMLNKIRNRYWLLSQVGYPNGVCEVYDTFFMPPNKMDEWASAYRDEIFKGIARCLKMKNALLHSTEPLEKEDLELAIITQRKGIAFSNPPINLSWVRENGICIHNTPNAADELTDIIQAYPKVFYPEPQHSTSIHGVEYFDSILWEALLRDPSLEPIIGDDLRRRMPTPQQEVIELSQPKIIIKSPHQLSVLDYIK